MEFGSILFECGAQDDAVTLASQPEFFVDLNLDQIAWAVTRGHDDYNLKPYFYIPLTQTSAIHYRHEVMRDLQCDKVLLAIRAFSEGMRAMRTELESARKKYYELQKERWMLDAIRTYCSTVVAFAVDLERAQPQSAGLCAFLDFIKAYCQTDEFRYLKAEEAHIRSALDKVNYGVLIRGSSVTVRKYNEEIDYTAEVMSVFEKFRQGEVDVKKIDFNDSPDMNHVEANILDFVARLHPDVFRALESYCKGSDDYLDESIARFDREIQFYVTYLEHMNRIKESGLNFCYPIITRNSKDVFNNEGFDLALAEKLHCEHRNIICNDFYLNYGERIIVVTGPNQGGKTTFARTFGQLHYLAALGLPIPGKEAKLFLFDHLFTHFERQEDMKNLRGKLHDDLYRIHKILGQATASSIVIMNEIFSSTSLRDALFLSNKVIDRIIELDALCVYVTFIEELSRRGPQTISMRSEVEQDEQISRTFKIKRLPADGQSYAISLAKKYHLTYDFLISRVQS